MNHKMRFAAVISAALAFLFCLTGGIWILTAAGLDHGDDAISTALGLYFIGKAFFVGPMLLMASLEGRKTSRPT